VLAVTLAACVLPAAGVLWAIVNVLADKAADAEWRQIDRVIEVSQADAEEMTRRMAREEGIFAGISSGGALWAALQVSREVRNAVIVTIVCDRGDRYLSTGVFPG